MTASEEPWRVIHEPGGYLLAPQGPEYIGDVMNVAFSCGWMPTESASSSSTTRRATPAATWRQRQSNGLVDYCRNTPQDPLFTADCVEQRIELIDKNLKLSV